MIGGCVRGCWDMRGGCGQKYAVKWCHVSAVFACRHDKLGVNTLSDPIPTGGFLVSSTDM